MADTSLTDRLEWKAQEYSVLITDEKKSSYGSGVLFYPGDGDMLYIFTCAHVLDDLEGTFVVRFLVPRRRELEDYAICTFRVPQNQAVYSPIDIATETEEGGREHSVDVAVLYFQKDADLLLEATDYCIAEAAKGTRLFAQGFPGETQDEGELLETLDAAHGKVLHNIPENHTFVFRVEDSFLDAAGRPYELKGFSGSPVWSGEDEVLSILGLMSSGVGRTVYRGRVNAVKMEAVRSIMQIHFHMHIDTRISGIPEKDVAGRLFEASFDGTASMEETENIYDKWLIGQTEKVRAYIDDIKLGKAIDLANETMRQEHFRRCSEEATEKHIKHLLYCYEITLQEEAYVKTESCLRANRLYKGHDPLRWMTWNFSRRNFAETAAYAKNLAEKEPGDTALGVIARMFAVICRAYTEGASAEETILQFLDENENLRKEIADPDTRALVYQMLGYVYGEHYKEHTRSVRCLNRSYRIGHDTAVLESLGCAYYLLSLKDALREDDTVDMEKVNRAELYKARECFLIILEKADDLYLGALLKRIGTVVFDTFYFLQDNYRIITLYPKVKESVDFKHEKEIRDIELKYAKVVIQGGRIDLSRFKALTDKDKLYFHLMGAMKDFMVPFESINPRHLSGDASIREGLLQLIGNVERHLEEIDGKKRLPILVELINLYGFGHRCFKWNVSAEIERHLDAIRNLGDGKLVLSLENFLAENSGVAEAAEARYLQAWDRDPSQEMWLELLHFYIRNWRFDKADRLYQELFESHADLIQDGPEYAFRGYIDYILRYRRDLKNALRIFVEHNEDFKDLNLRDFWEHELMVHTGSFNDPERFEAERRSFVQQELIPQEEFHRIVLVAYMCNLNSGKAWEHFNKDNPYFGLHIQEQGAVPQLSREGALFLVWQRKYPPHREPQWNGIMEKNVRNTLARIAGETWHQEVEGIKRRLGFALERNIAIDAWALYLVAVDGRLDTLEGFDHVYVTHSTVTRMLDEMCHFENPYFMSVLAYFEGLGNLMIVSPDFVHQLMVREAVPGYFEPCSTLALALEKGCIAVIGEPSLQREMVDCFKDRIVRPVDYGCLVL